MKSEAEPLLGVKTGKKIRSKTEIILRIVRGRDAALITRGRI